MAPEHSVFVSYRRDDTQFFARLLADRLSEQYRVFTDVGAIQPGIDFMEAVRTEVSTCDVLLAVIGPQWSTISDESGQPRILEPRDVVALEISSALQRNIRVIPVLVEQARMPAMEDLPPSLAALATRNGISFRNEAFDSDLARLETAIRNAVGVDGTERAGAAASVAPAALAAPSSQVEPPAPPKVPRPPKRRGYLFGLLKNKRQLVAASALAAVVLLLVLILGIGALVAKLDPGLSEGNLRAHVPASFRDSCQTYQPTEDTLQFGLKSGLVCTPGEGGPQQVIYLAYHDAASADSNFASWLPAGLRDQDCTAYWGKSVSPRGPAVDGRKRPGTLACFPTRDNSKTVFAWTDDSIAVVAVASDPKLQIGAMSDWWKNSGGPI